MNSMQFLIEEEFTAFDEVPGSFVLQGENYPNLLRMADKYRDRIEGIVARVGLNQVDKLPSCHLSISLDKCSPEELLDQLHRFDPKLVSFFCTQPKNLLAKLKVMQDQPFEVDLSMVLEEMDTDSIDELLNYYLYNLSNKVLLQPFHALLDGFLNQRVLSSWSILWMDPGKRVGIHQNKVGFWGPQGEFQDYGSLKEDDLGKSAKWLKLVEAKANTFKKDDTCMHCRYFFCCEGGLKVLLGKCDQWLAVMERLYSAASEIKTQAEKESFE